MSPRSFLRWWTAAPVGLLLGIALGILLADGHWGPAGLAIAGAGALAMIGFRVVPQDQRYVGQVLVVAYALRAAAAVVLYTGSLAMGRGGFVTGDDAAYATLAWAFVQFTLGGEVQPWVPPYWAGEAYLFGTYVYLESFLFWIFGREVLVALLTNAVLGTVTLVFAHDIARR